MRYSIEITVTVLALLFAVLCYSWTGTEAKRERIDARIQKNADNILVIKSDLRHIIEGVNEIRGIIKEKI